MAHRDHLVELGEHEFDDVPLLSTKNSEKEPDGLPSRTYLFALTCTVGGYVTLNQIFPY
jgi:hypothetical protein